MLIETLSVSELVVNISTQFVIERIVLEVVRRVYTFLTGLGLPGSPTPFSRLGFSSVVVTTTLAILNSEKSSLFFLHHCLVHYHQWYT